MDTFENTFDEHNIKPIIHYYKRIDSCNIMAYVGRNLIVFFTPNLTTILKLT